MTAVSDAMPASADSNSRGSQGMADIPAKASAAAGV